MRQFTNNDKGIGALLAWMTDLEGVEQIIFEPTSRYHKVLERALITKQYPYARINGYQIKRFADSIGRRAISYQSRSVYASPGRYQI